MAVSNIKATFNSSVEYTKEGYATTFTVTAVEVGKRWEFDMENGNLINAKVHMKNAGKMQKFI